MFFDIEFERKFYNEIINYGIIKGNNIVLLIKPGQDGTLCGYENKYLQIAQNIHKEYGCTVVCTSNPYDGKHNPFIDAIEVINELNIDNPKIYYIGNSCGAMLGARYGYLYNNIEKMLLINAPLFKNVDLLTSGLRKFNGEKVVLIYGEYDPSTPYITFFDNIDRVKYYILENEEHNINTTKLIELPKKHLFN